MMKKGNLLSYTIIFISLLLSLPARFAYGLMGIFFLFLLTLCQSLLENIFYSKNMIAYLRPFSCIFIVFLTIILKGLLILFSPLLAFTMGFSMYLIAAALLLFSFIYSDEENPANGKKIFSKKMSVFLPFALLSLFYFLLRDIISFGTITLPSVKGLFVIELFKMKGFSFIGIFFSSIPGALILLALVVILISHVNKKLEIVRVMNIQEKIKSTGAEDKSKERNNSYGKNENQGGNNA